MASIFYMDLVVFDLDGVLLDSREAHYQTLNEALSKLDPKFVISRHEHETEYDGKPTHVKLKMLTATKGLDPKLYDEIWNMKQLLTVQYIQTEVQRDDELVEILKSLKLGGSQVACASNSIYQTVKASLLKLGVMEHIDYFLSNEDIKNPKPHPEIYYRCMIRSNMSPKQVTIVEDSPVGLEAARRSGANVIQVRSRKDVKKTLFANPGTSLVRIY